MTMVVRQLTILTDRLCDLDADGDPDNAIADLGDTNGQLFAMGINTLLEGGADHRLTAPVVAHVPLVEDLTIPDDPAVVMILFEGLDDEVVNPERPEERGTRDASDDFSGDERFWVKANNIDACGEPLHCFPGANIGDGTLMMAESGSISLAQVGIPPTSFIIDGARIRGTIEPFGRQADLWACGYGRVQDLALARNLGPNEHPDLTLLEILLAGGAAFGMPTMPGLTPDVDLDGDGLERFELDADSRLTACIDGDGHTVVPGRDCWQDERFADGVSINAELQTVGAQLVGLEPGWRDLVSGECDAWPSSSLWDSR
jgi:hypothetical protein